MRAKSRSKVEKALLISDEVLLAPARGKMVACPQMTVLAVGAEDFVVAPERYRAGAPGRERDIFDDMTDRATRRGGDKPFTVGQVAVGRAYRDFAQKVMAAGYKTSSTFDARVDGGRVDFMNQYLRDVYRLGMFQRAIGSDVALSPRQMAVHSMDRGARRLITTRDLVDSICLREPKGGLSAVLVAHHWSVSARNVKALRAALCAALERMQGV